jgi:hypothetical protein
MAPTNDWLMDASIQQQLAAHDPKLIKGSTTWFPGEEPVEHWDFHRPREMERLAEFLESHTDLDFRNGNVTVDDAAMAVYGLLDPYLTNRIRNVHLNPSSGFNKTRMDGTIAVVDVDEATIIQDDRNRVALAVYQARLDRYQEKVGKAIAREGKGVKRAERRALRIAPTSEEKLREVTEQTVEATFQETRRTLGTGS